MHCRSVSKEDSKRHRLERFSMEKHPSSCDNHFHVLAVDDSLIDRKVLEKLLTVSSYEVTSVESGSKALEFLGLMDDTSSSSCQRQDVKVNLIITDYCMPGMSGYELLKRIKESSWKDIPVVVMSSENVPSRITRCLEGGAEEFLLKPVKLSDMKKLHPHILKSQKFNNDNTKSTNPRKRKAVSPQPLEKSPKRRGLRDILNRQNLLENNSKGPTLRIKKKSLGSIPTSFRQF